MTEAEWRTCTDDPIRMLREVCSDANQRKLDLYACACKWTVREALAPEDLASLAELEKVIDNNPDSADQCWERLTTIENGLAKKVWDYQNPGAFTTNWEPETAAIAAVFFPGVQGLHLKDLDLVKPFADWAGAHARCFGPAVAAAWQRARSRQCDLVRDIFGDYDRPVAIQPEWLTWNGGAVRKLASSIDEVGRFDHLPILADALEEAGCQDQELLRHCRASAEHVRGCWAIDTLLGRPPVVWYSS